MNQGWWLWSTGLLRKPPPSGGGGGELLMQQGWCALQPPCGQCGAHTKISKNQRKWGIERWAGRDQVTTSFTR